MSENDQILQTLKKHSEAVYNKDGAALSDQYSAESIAFDLAPPLVLDSSTLRDPHHYESWFKTWDGPIRSEFHDKTVRVQGNLAAVYGLQNMTGRKKDGYEVDLWFRSTAILLKENEEWKIVHFHNSVPFAMDGSYKALVDLQPEKSI